MFQIDFKDGDGNSNHKWNGIMLVNSYLVDNRYYEFTSLSGLISVKVNRN